MEKHQEKFHHVIECTVGEDCRKWREGNRCNHSGRLHIGGPKVKCLDYMPNFEWRREKIHEEHGAKKG